MVIELLEGGSLYDELKENALLSSKQIKTIIFGLLRGSAIKVIVFCRIKTHA
jgi:serine/threonine protein kinase